MARIRTIKPEFPGSETIGELSREARLCFILLWTVADDEGRCRAAIRVLCGALYPFDDDAPDLMEGWLVELERAGCIIRYQIERTKLLQVCNWKKHQRIDKPSGSRLPAPTEIQDSENTLGSVERLRDPDKSYSEPSSDGPRNTYPGPGTLDEAWVSVREQVTQAFEAAGSPIPVNTSHVDVWRLRGHDPQICIAVVAETLSRKKNISRLTYFDQAIADRHVAPQPQVRDGPRRRPSHDGRHDVLAELRAAKDGKRDHHDTAGRPTGEPDQGTVSRLERVP